MKAQSQFTSYDTSNNVVRDHITGIKPNVYHIIKETFRKQLILVNKTIPAFQHFAIGLSHLRGKAVQVKVEKDFSSGT